MNTPKIASRLLLMFVVVAFPRAPRAADEELVVIVNGANAAMPSTDQLEKLFLCTLKRWPDGTPAVPFNYGNDNAIRQAFDKVVLRLDPAGVGRFWVDQRVREGIRPPRVVSDHTWVVRLVANMKGGIGYVPVNLVTPQVKVVARIRGGQLLSP